jgi:hypothetical protein
MVDLDALAGSKGLTPKEFLDKNLQALPRIFRDEPQEAVVAILGYCRNNNAAGLEKELSVGIQALGTMIGKSNAFALPSVTAGDLILLKEAMQFIRNCRDTASTREIQVTYAEVRAMVGWKEPPSGWHNAPVYAIPHHHAEEKVVVTKESGQYVYGHPIGDSEHINYQTRIKTDHNQAILTLAGDVLVDIVADHPWMRNLAKGQKVDFKSVAAMREQLAYTPDNISARAGIKGLVAADQAMAARAHLAKT